MTRVSIVWGILLSGSILLLFYLGGWVSVEEKRIFRFEQPAYAEGLKDDMQKRSHGRNLKTGDSLNPTSTSPTETAKDKHFLEDDKKDETNHAKKREEEKPKIITTEKNKSSSKLSAIGTEIKRTKEGIIIRDSQKKKLRQNGIPPVKYKEKPALFSFADFKGGKDSKPVRTGIQQTLGRLNYEFSSKVDKIKANEPKFRVPAFLPSNANNMDIVGNIKVGGKVPVQSARQILIATTWRSGSTFLGDLLNHYPGTFYYFEPLHYFSHADAEGLELKQTETDFLRSLYNCTFDKKNIGFLHHVAKAKNKFLLKNHNFRLWNSCKNILPKEIMCLEPIYLNQVCPLFPIKLIKSVRLRVKNVETMLRDPAMDLKVVVLVRDPRGVYNSRSSGAVSTWCNKDQCADPAVGCSDLSSDVKSAVRLQEQYPGSVTLVRYEDLSLFPEDTTKNLLKFLDLPWNSAMEAYINTHTSRSKAKMVRNKKTHKLQRKVDTYGTTRNSTATAFAWMEKLTFQNMTTIQDACKEPMEDLGYKLMSDKSDLKSHDLPLEKTAKEVWPFN